MKKRLILPALGLCFVASTITMADSQETISDVKRLGIVSSSILLGIASMGPLGAVPGLLTGAWLDQEISDADRVESVEEKLFQANSRIRDMGEQLATYQLSAEEYARIALEQLHLELLFKTAAGALTKQGVERLSFLAKFLSDNPDINVRLDGYADPRGDDLDNQRLSEERVDAVFKQLVSKGVNTDRIKKHSHGAGQSLSALGDYDSYALDRVVKIQLLQQDKDAFAGIINSD